MEADVRWCAHCRQRGEKKRLRLLQINDSLAVLLCENEKCVRVGETSSISTVILQRKASDIPNTKKKKAKPNAALKIPNSSPPNGSVPSSNPESTRSLSEKQTCGTSVDSDHPSGNFLSSAGTPRVLLWANKSSLCWLDACLCVLVACRSLHGCLAVLPPKSSVVRTLCAAFTEAQRKRPTIKCETSDSTCGGSRLADASVPPPIAGQTGAVRCDADVKATADNERRSLDSTRSGLCQAHGEGSPLDRARDEIYQRLQPTMTSRGVGEEDSPVVALPSLLRLDGSHEEHFMCRYRSEFCCGACGHTQVDMSKTTMITSSAVPADFTMSAPTMLHSCHKCGSPQQTSRLVFHSLSACVMMHFPGGLPGGDLSKHLTFDFLAETYTLTAAVRYRRDPNHFVTVVRDRETDHWLEYDDLVPSPYTWQSQAPEIPSEEVHMLLWERLGTPCTACSQTRSHTTSILEAPLPTPPASGLRAGNADAAPKQSRSAHGNGAWRKKRFSLSSAFLGKPAAEREAVSRGNDAGHGSGAAGVDKEPLDVVSADKDANGSTTNIDPTAEMESATTVDPQPQIRPEPKSEPLGDSDSRSLSQVGTKETTELSSCNNRATKGLQGTTKTERVKDSGPNATRKHELKTDVPHPTFLGSLASRRKSNTVRDQTRSTSAILAKIPEQLLKFSRQSHMMSCAPPTRDAVSRNASVLSRIPQQLLSGSAHPEAAPPQPSRSEPSSRAARPILVGASHRVAAKQVKFQPYGQSLDQKRQQENRKTNQGFRSSSSSSNNAGTLSSWQKRVGMYTSAVDVPAKRARRDSCEDGSSTCSDPPRHLGPPCSSVSSPSACSDISSLSDNQSFAGGKDDLTSTIDELCKVLDIGADRTPSASSRLSSPSKDMFFSELFADVPESDRSDPIPDPNRRGLRTPTASEHSLVTMTTEMSKRSPRPLNHLQPSVHELRPACVTAPPVDRFRPDVTADTTSTPARLSRLQKQESAAAADPLGGTLPSIGTQCPALAPAAFPAQSQSAMLPSCDQMSPTTDPVAMQPDSKRSKQLVDNLAVHSDRRTGASGFSTMTDTDFERNVMAFSSGRRCDANQGMDDLIDTGLLEDVQDTLDMLGSEWNDNLIDLLA